MTHVYDVAVVGGGAMGSAAAWALSAAGREVVLLEQYELGHDRGGSHGATRIFRVGSEQTDYVDLALRARELWEQLESETGQTLITATGAIEHGMGADKASAFGALLDGQGIDHEVLDADAARDRWPGMRFDGPVLHQPGAGVLHADRVVAGLQQLARRQGVEVRAGVRVERIDVSDPSVVVLETPGGAVRARDVVVTVGSWTPGLLAGVIAVPRITVTQEQPHFFEPRDASDAWPCFVHWRDGQPPWGHWEAYGLVEAGAGVKVGLHGSGPVIDPDRRDFAPETERHDALREYVREWLPGLDPELGTPISCLYDNTELRTFVIDRVGPIAFAAGFNGEGFKFVPAIGELLRDLVTGDRQPPPLFTLARHPPAG